MGSKRLRRSAWKLSTGRRGKEQAGRKGSETRDEQEEDTAGVGRVTLQTEIEPKSQHHPRTLRLPYSHIGRRERQSQTQSPREERRRVERQLELGHLRPRPRPYRLCSQTGES